MRREREREREGGLHEKKKFNHKEWKGKMKKRWDERVWLKSMKMRERWWWVRVRVRVRVRVKVRGLS